MPSSNTPGAAARDAETQAFLDHVIREAALPSMLPAPTYPALPLGAENQVLEGLSKAAAAYVARCLSRADNLRKALQAQTLATLTVLTNPELVDEARLYDPATLTRRKPRICLWAEQGEDMSLSAYWRPLRDSDDLMSVADEGYCETSDYLSMGNIRSARGREVPGNQIFCFNKRDYESSPGEKQGKNRPLQATWEVCQALDDGLRFLVEALSAFCTVKVEAWPSYDSGELHILEDDDRAYEMLNFALGAARDQLSTSSQRAAERAAVLGFSSVEEFSALKADCAGDEDLKRKLRALGKKFTSHQFNALKESAALAGHISKTCIAFKSAVTLLEKSWGIRHTSAPG